jgi:hypothetical protein
MLSACVTMAVAYCPVPITPAWTFLSGSGVAIVVLEWVADLLV